MAASVSEPGSVVERLVVSQPTERRGTITNVAGLNGDNIDCLVRWRSARCFVESRISSVSIVLDTLATSGELRVDDG
jgi:hypothetical protein